MKFNRIRKNLVALGVFMISFNISSVYNVKMNKPEAAEMNKTDLYVKSLKYSFEEIDALKNKIDQQIAIADEHHVKYQDLIKVEIKKEEPKHREDCLEKECWVRDCLTHRKTSIDYNYGDMSAIAFDSNGQPIYSKYAVRDVELSAEEFIQIIAPLAQEAQAQFGIPASTLIAQAGLETGWGNHIIGNNIFGIKDSNTYNGPTVIVTTTEYVDGVYHTIDDIFKGYNSIGEAIYDYSKNVISKNYPNVINGNWIDSIHGLDRYATNPEYFNLLKNIVDTFNLTQYNDI